MSIRPSPTADEVRQLREAASLSTRAFAALAGVKQSTVWRWERGISAMHPDTWDRVRAIIMRGAALGQWQVLRMTKRHGARWKRLDTIKAQRVARARELAQRHPLPIDRLRQQDREQ